MAQSFYNRCRKESLEKAEWLVVGKIDPFYHRPNGCRHFLQDYSEQNKTLVIIKGYKMTADLSA